MRICPTPNCGVCAILVRAAERAPKKEPKVYALDIEDKEYWRDVDEDWDDRYDFDDQAELEHETASTADLQQLQEAWNTRYHSR